MQLLHNQMEELAAITINSEWIKTGIDLLTELLGLLTSVVDKLGSIPAIIGGISGAILGITNNGVQIRGEGIPVVGGLISRINSVLGGSGQKGRISTYMQSRKSVSKFNKENKGKMNTSDLLLLDKLDKTFINSNNQEEALSAKQAIMNEFNDLDDFFGQLSESAQKKLKEGLWDKIKTDSADAVVTASDLVNEVTGNMADSAIESMVQAQESINNTNNKIASFAKTALSGLLNAGIVSLTSFAVSAIGKSIIDAYDEWKHHSENLIKAGEEAKAKIQDVYKTIEESNSKIKDSAVSIGINVKDADTTRKTLSSIAEKYTELKKGVNALTNANKTLTTDKYKEYLNLCNSLADQFPELVKGYDDQGNAVLNLSGNVDICKNSLDDMYKVTLDIAHTEIGGSLGTSIKGLLEQVRVAKGEIESLDSEMEILQGNLDRGSGGVQVDVKMDEPGLVDQVGAFISSVLGADVEPPKTKKTEYVSFQSAEQFEGWYDQMTPQWINVGVDEGEIEYQKEILKQEVETLIAGFDVAQIPIPFSLYLDFEYNKDTQDALDQGVEDVTAEFNRQIAEKTTKALNKKQQEKTLQENQIKGANSEFAKNVGYFLNTNSTFETVNDSLRNAILTNLNAWTLDDLDIEINKNTTDEEIFEATDKFIDENIVNVLASIPDDIQQKVANVLDNTYDTTAVSDYIRTIYEDIVDAAGGDNQLATTLMKALGIGNSANAMFNKRETIQNMLGSLGFSGSDFAEMTMGELDRAFALVTANTYKTLDKFWGDLRDKSVTIKDGVLNDIFKDTNFTDQAKTLTDSLSAITTALGNAVGGQVTGSAQTALVEAFKGISDVDFGSDFSVANVQEVGVQQLERYMNLFYKTAEAQNLSDKEMIKANTYIMNMVKSYEMLGVTADDVINNITENFAESTGDWLEGAKFGRKFREEFENELGDKTKRQILFSLQANPESATWTVEQWREQYDQATVTWKLFIDMDNFKKQMAVIESRLGLNSEKNSAEDQKIEAKQYEGNYDTAEEINNKIQNNLDSIADLQEKLNALTNPANEESITHKLAAGSYTIDGSFDTEAYRKDWIEFQTQVTKLQNEIASKEMENFKLSDDVEFIDIDILDKGILNDMNFAYNELKSKADEYGEALIPDSLLTDIVSSAQNIIDQNQTKLNLADAILSTKGISEPLKQRAQEAKEAATRVISSTLQDLNNYIQKLDIGQEQSIIETLLGTKEKYKKDIEDSGKDITEQNYTFISNINNSLIKAYDDAIIILSKKKGKYEDLITNGVKLDGIQQSNYKAYNDLYKQYLGERNTLKSENIKNDQAIRQITADTLERQATKYSASTDRMIAAVEKRKKNGRVKVNEQMYSNIIERLIKSKAFNNQMADLYEEMAVNALSDVDKFSFTQKAQSYRDSNTTISGNIEDYEKKIRNLGIEDIDIALNRVTVEADTMKDALDNSLKPLTKDDYSNYVSKLAEKYDLLTQKSKEYAEQKAIFDNNKIDPSTTEYEELQSNIDSVDASLRQLEVDIRNNKNLSESVDFTSINDNIKATNDEISRLQTDQQGKSNRGERLKQGDYVALENAYADSIEENQAGMNEAVQRVRDMLSKNGMFVVSDNLIDQIFSGDYSSQMFNRADVDQNAIKSIVSEWNTYYQQRESAEQNLYQTEQEHEESHANLLKSGLETRQSETEAIVQQNDALREIRNLTQNEIDAESESYKKQVPILEALEIEYTKLRSKYKEGTDGYIKYNSLLTETSKTLEQVRQKQNLLNQEMVQNSISDLANDMKNLQNEYQKYENKIGKTSSDEDEYRGMIDVTRAQQMNKYAEASNYDLLAQLEYAQNGESKKYTEFTQQAEQARREAEKYTSQIKQLGDAIKALPENRIAQTMGVLESRAGMQRANLSYTSTKNNGVISPSDYTDIIKTDKDQVKQQEKLVNELKDRQRTATEDYTAALSHFGSVELIPQEILDEYTEANSEYYNAESVLLQKQEQVAKDYQGANETLLSAYNESVRILNLHKGELDRQKLIDDAMGKRRDQAEIEADISFTQDSLSSAMEALNNLDISDYQGDDKEAIKIKFEADQEQLKQTIAEARAELIRLGQEEDMIPINNIQRVIETYEDEWADFEETRKKASREGRDLTDEENQSMLDNIENRRYWIENVKNLYEGLYEENKGTTVGDSMLEGIRQMKQQLSNLDEEEYEIEYGINMKPLNDLQEKMGYLTRSAEEFQGVLGNPLSTANEKAEALSGLIENSDDQIKNLERQAIRYKGIMKQIEISDPKNYVLNDEYIKMAEGLATAEKGMKELAKSTHEYVIALQELPLETIQTMMEFLQTLNSVEESRRELKVAEGGTLTPEDFAGTIANNEGRVKQAEDAYNITQENLSKAIGEMTTNLTGSLFNSDVLQVANTLDKNSKDILEARDKDAEAEANLNKTRAELLESQKEAFEAGQQQYQGQRAVLQSQMAVLDAERELSETKGYDTRTISTINTDIANASADKTSLETELGQLEANKGLYSDTEYKAKYSELQTGILETETKIFNLRKEILELPLKGPERQLKLLQQSNDELEEQKRKYQELGQAVPNSLLEDQIENATQRQGQLKLEKGIYSGLIAGAEFILGKGSPLGEDFIEKTGWRDKLKEVESGITETTVFISNTNEEMIDNNISSIDFALDQLQTKAKKLQKVLSNSFDNHTADDYNDSIENATAQMDQLVLKRKEVEDKILAGPEEGKSWTEDDPRYMELKSQLDSIDLEYEELRDGVAEWGRAMANLDLEKANNALAEHQTHLARIEEYYSNKQELGYHMTEDDYTRLGREYETEADLAYNAYQEAFKKTVVIPGTNVTADGTEVGSEAYKGLVGDMESAYDAYLEILHKIEVNNRDMEWLPIENLEIELDYVVREADALKESLATPSNNETKASILTQLIGNNATQLQNLADQAVEYQERMHEIEKSNPDDYLFNDKYIKASTGLSNVNQNMKTLNQETREYSEQLRNLPLEGINRMIDYLNALNSLNDTKRAIKQAQGMMLTPEDYATDIANAEQERNTRQGALNIARNEVEFQAARLNYARLHPEDKRLSSVESIQADWEATVVSATEAEDELLKAELAVIQARREAYDAGMEQYNQRLGFLENYKALLDKERELAEARGEDIIARENITTDIQISAESKKALEEELTNLDSSKLSPLEYSQEQVRIRNAIADADKQILEYNKQLAELPIRETEKAYDRLKKFGDEIDSAIAAHQNLGELVPEGLFDTKLQNITDQRENVVAQRQFYSNLINTTKKSGAFGEFITDIFGWDDKLADLDKQMLDLDVQRQNTNEQKNKQALDIYTNQLNALKREAQKTQKVLDNIKIPNTVGKYTTLIKNATSQQSVLLKQMQNIQTQMKDYKDQDDPGYQNLLTQLNGLRDEYDNLTESVNQWHQAIIDLPMEKINRALELNGSNLEYESSEREEKTARGELVTDADYKRTLAIAKNNVDQKNSALNIKRTDLENAEHDYEEAGTEENLIILQNARKEFVDAQTELNKAEIEFVNTNKEAMEASLAAHERRIKELDLRKQELDSYSNINEAYGRNVGRSALKDAYQLSLDYIDIYQGELAKFDEEHIGKLTPEEKERRAGIATDLAQAMAQASEEQRKYFEFDSLAMYDMVEHYANGVKDATNNLEDLKRTGQEITAEDYNIKIGGLESQQGQIDSLINFFNGLIDEFGESHPEWAKTWGETIRDLTEQYRQLGIEIEETGKERDNLPLEHLKNQLEDMQRISKRTQEVLSDDEIVKTASMYEKAISDAEKEQENLNLQMTEVREQMRGLDKDSEVYRQHKSTLEGLQDEYRNITKQTREWEQAIKDLPLDKIQRERENAEVRSRQTSGRNAIAEALGVSADYEAILADDKTTTKLARETVDVYYDRMQDALTKYNNRKGKLGEDIARENYEQAIREWLGSQADVDEAIAQELASTLAVAKAPLDVLGIQMEAIQTQANALKSTVEDTLNYGSVATEEQYTQLNEFNVSQMENLKAQEKEWQEYRNVLDGLIEKYPELSGQANKLYNEIDSATAQITRDMVALTEATLEYNMMLNGGIDLHNLGQAQTALEQQAQRINNQISMQEANNQAVTLGLYQDIADNTFEQIENIAQQNEALERQQSTVGITVAKYQELQAQIESNANSISDTSKSLMDYNRQIANYATNYATQLQSAISSALSESSSDTGLTSAVMESLIGQFRNLSDAGMDFSSIFYQTSQGIKLNTFALQQMVKIQREAFGKNVSDNITKENALIKQQTGQIERNGIKAKTVDAETLKNHEKKMTALRNEVSQYNAIMSGIENTIGAFAQWQQAESSANPGANYQAITSAMLDMEQRIKRGETGTDEFQKFVEMMSPLGLSTPEEFDRLYNIIARYFDNSKEGMDNFLADLQKFGFNANDVLDVNELSNAFGLSETAINALLGQLRDYGTDIITVRDEIDAQAQIMENSERIIELNARKNSATSQTVRAELESQIQNLREENEKLNAYIGDISNTGMLSSDEFAKQKQQLTELLGYAEHAFNEIEKSQFESEAKAIDNRLFNADTYDEYMKAYQKSADAVAQSMPDISSLVSETIQEYQTGMDQLRQAAEGIVDVDFFRSINADTTYEEISENFRSLENLRMNITQTPEAQEALDRITKILANEGRLKLLIDNSDEITMEQLASLSEEQIIAELNIDKEDREFIDFVMNKRSEMIMTVELSQNSIDALSQAMKVDPELSENSEELLKAQLEGLDLPKVDVNANENTLVTSIKDALNNTTFTAKVVARTNLGNGVITESATAHGTLGKAFAHGTSNVKDGRIQNDQVALTGELGPELRIDKDGNMELLTGMQLRELHKGDIILNHKQTEQLQKTGKASGQGQIVGGESAFAHGTISALAGGTDSIIEYFNPSPLIHYYNSLTGASMGNSPYSHYESNQNRLSYEMFDLFASKADRLSDVISQLSNSVKEHMSTTMKSNILAQKSIAVNEQINTYNKQALDYRGMAGKQLREYWYTDSNNNLTSMNIEEKIKEYGFSSIDEIISGAGRIEKIDTSTEEGRKLVEGIKAYQSLIQQAEQAEKASLDLANQLADVRFEIINLPFEDMERSLKNLNREMEVFSSFSEVASMGDAAARRLMDNLEEIFGIEARRMFDASGKSYEILNRQIEENIKNTRQQVIIEKDAAEKSRNIADNYRINNNISKQDLEGIKSQLMNQLNSNDAYRSFGDVNGTGMDQMIVASETYDEKTQGLIATFNQLLTLIRSTDEAIAKSDEEYKDHMVNVKKGVAEWAKLEETALSQRLDNVKNYYDKFTNYNDVLLSLSKADADYIEQYLDLTANAPQLEQYYREMMDINARNIEYYKTILQLQEQELANELASGKLRQTDSEYLEAKTQILQTQAAIKGLQAEQASLNKSLMELPSKILQEKLKDIENAYNAVTSAISKNLASSQSLINAYNRIAPAGHNVFAGMSGLSWQLQNALLQQDTQRAKQEAQAAIEGYQTAQANYNSALGGTAEQMKAAKDALDEATALMNEKVMDAAIAEIENFEKGLSNINDYYQSSVTYIDALISGTKTANSYLEETIGYLFGSGDIMNNYNKILKRTDEQYSILAEDLANMESELARGVANGTIVFGDVAWNRLATSIENVRNQMDQLRVTQAQTYKEMLQIPEKEVTEKIEQLNRMRRGLAAASNNSIADSTSMRVMANYENARIRAEFGEVGPYGYTGDIETFIHQNGVIKDNLTTEEEILRYREEQLRQQKALTQRVREMGATSEEIYLADVEYEKVQASFLEQQAKVIAMRVNSVNQMIDNVESYYQNFNSVIDKSQARLEAYRNFAFNNTNVLDTSMESANARVEIRDSYTEQMLNNVKQQENLKAEYDRVQQLLNEGLDSGRIIKYSEDWRKIISTLDELDTQLVETKQKQLDLFNDMINIPQRAVEERLKNIEKAYTRMYAGISHGANQSLSQMRAYNEYYIRMMEEGNIFIKNRSKYEHEYQAQNELLQQQTIRAHEEEYAATQALVQARTNLDKAKLNPELYTDEEIKKLEDAVDSLEQIRAEKIAIAAEADINNWLESLNNVVNYYEKINGYIDSEIESLKIQKQINEEIYKNDTELVFQKNQSLNNQIIKKIIKERDNLYDVAATLEENLNREVMRDNIVEGDSKWLEMKKQIQDTQNRARQLDVSILELYRDMENLPDQTIENKLEDITEKFRILNAIIDNNILDSQSMIAVLNRLGEEMLATVGDMGQIFISENPIKGVNQFLNKSLEQENEVLSLYYTDMIAKNEAYEEAMNDSEINETELENMRKSAREASAKYFEQQNKEIAKQNQIATKFLETIRSYYSSYIDFYQTMAQRASKLRNNIIENLNISGNVSKIGGYVTDEAENYLKQRNNMELSLEAQEAQLQLHLDTGVFKEGSQEYIDAMNNIENLKDQIIDLDNTELQLFKDMLQIPSQVVSEKLDEIARAYNGLNVALNNNLLATSDGQKMYAEYSQMLQRVADKAVAVAPKLESTYKVDPLAGIAYTEKQQKQDANNQNYRKAMQEMANIQKRLNQEANNLTSSIKQNAKSLNGTSFGKMYDSIKAQLNSAKDKMKEIIPSSIKIGADVRKDLTKFEKKFDNLYAQQIKELDKITLQVARRQTTVKDAINNFADGLSSSLNNYSENMASIIKKQSVKDSKTVANTISKATTNSQKTVSQATQNLINKLASKYSLSSGTWFPEIGNFNNTKTSVIQNAKTKERKTVTADELKKILGINGSNYKELKFVVKNAKIEDSGNIVQAVAKDLVKASDFTSYTNYYNPNAPTFVGENQAYLDNYNQKRQEATLKVQNMVAAQQLYEGMNSSSKIYSEAQLKAAKDQLERTKQEAQEAIGEVTKLSIEMHDTFINNIENYFSRMTNFFQVLNANLQSTNDYIISTFGYARKSSQITLNLQKLAEGAQQRININQAELKSMVDQYYQDSGKLIDKNGDKATETLTKMQGLIGNIISDSKELVQYWNQFYDVVNQTATESLDKLQKKYSPLTAMQNNQILNTRSTQQILGDYNNMNKYARSGYKSNGTRYTRVNTLEVPKETFVLQNAQLDIELQKSAKELEIYDNALTQAGRNLDAVIKKDNVKKEEILAAQKVFETARSNWLESNYKNQKKMIDTIMQQAENIKSYYDDLIQYNQSALSKIDKQFEMSKAFGRNVDKNTGVVITDTTAIMNNYNNKMQNLKENSKLTIKAIVEIQQKMDVLRKTTGENTEEYRQLDEQLNSYKNTLKDNAIGIEQLNDQFRQDFYFAPIDNYIARVQTLRKNIEGIGSMISDDMKVTDQGHYTDFGVFSLTMTSNELSLQYRELQKIQEQRAVMTERYNKDMSYSEEEYTNDMQALAEKQQSAIQGIMNSQKSLISTMQLRYRTEIDYIKKLIQAQQDELNKRKSLADYDRDIKNKAKSIQQIKAQIRALESLIKQGVPL